MFKFLSHENFKSKINLISTALVILMIMQMLITVFVSNSRRVERFNNNAEKAFTESSVTLNEMLDVIKEIVLTAAAERDVNHMMLSEDVSLTDMRNYRRTVDDVCRRSFMRVNAFYVYNDKTHTLYDRAFNRVHIDNLPDSETKSQIIRGGQIDEKMVIFTDGQDFITESSEYFQNANVLRLRYYPSFRSKSCIIADVNMKKLAEVFENYNEKFFSKIFMLDSAGSALYGSDNSIKSHVEADMKHIFAADFSSPVLRNYDGEKYLVLRHNFEKTGLCMLSLIPNSAVKTDLSETRTLLYTNLSLVIAILVVLILCFIIRWINETYKEKLKRQQRDEALGRHSRFVAKKQYLVNCLFKPDEQDIGKAREYLSDLLQNEKCDLSRVSVLRMEIYGYEKFVESYSNRDVLLYKYGICNICEEIINKYLRAIAVFERNAEIVFLLFSDNTEACRTAFGECQEAVKEYVDIQLSAMLSEVGELSDLPKIYSQTQQLAEYGFMLEGAVFLDASLKKKLVSADEKEMNERFDCVCADLAEGRRTELEKLYEWLGTLFIDDAKNVLWMLMFKIFNICKRNGRSFDSIGNLAAKFNSLKSMSAMKDFFEKLIENTFGNEAESELSDADDRMQMVREIIERNFQNPNFCSTDVAEELNLSKAYLSQKYKQATGNSISEAINERRMEAFANDLLTTDKSVKNIIENIGGVNHNYFMMMFKKKYGMTPTEYRQEFKLHLDA